MKKGGPYMSDMDRKIAASKRKTGKSKRLRKAQPGMETADASEMQPFNPMFYGGIQDGSRGTNYVAQTFGTGPDMFPYEGGIGGMRIASGSGYGQQFPGAPDASMYGGNQRKYIRALNKFEKDMLKDYRDLYTDGATPTQTSTSRLGQIPGTQQYLDAANKLHSYVNSEIAMINEANKNAGTGKRNKRTKGRGNKNRLFR